MKTQKIQRSKTKIHSATLTEEEIDQTLSTYFATHETITRRQFQVLCSQVKSTAQRLLKRLLDDGKLRNIATSQHPVYMPANGHYESVTEK